ncbi:MAG: GIY-YIG nuclease family protein [Lachnospiraceae bacterium]|nr:GIY-YIG nuclease family protein [Lachnospiraceae bacterium]
MGTDYVYILACADGSLYTGWTNDLAQRIKAHNSGAGAKYTRSRRPVTLVYSASFPTKEEAMREEWRIKHLTREEKLAMIREKKEEPLEIREDHVRE